MELVINTYGTLLSRDREGFLIVTKEGEQRIPVASVDSIQVSRGIKITSDAIILAIENEVQLVFSEKCGKQIGRVWSNKYGSISTIRKGQLNFSLSKDATEWIKKIILEKIKNQLAFILSMSFSINIENEHIKSSQKKLTDYMNKIKSLDGHFVADIAPSLRGWEGAASKEYYKSLNQYIPEEYQFAKRSQNPAKDIANALLNYGYGMLYGKIEGILIKVGIDPYVGILHRDDYNRPVLVYDIIEKYRIWIDYIVYALLSQKVITEEFYSIREDGSFWLEKLGRRILIQSVNDYFEEVITLNGLNRSRITHVQLFAQDLAQLFKKYNAE